MHSNSSKSTRELVSIRRKKIDSNKIQGFILGESKHLLLINYIYDFRDDGIMVLRKKDISDVRSTDTCKFQTKMLQDDGIYQSINFNVRYELDSWREFFRSAIDQHKIFIVEQELIKEPDFAIGRIVGIKSDHLKLKYFTGVARWLDDIEVIDFSNITSVQLNSNYIQAYERYFERTHA